MFSAQALYGKAMQILRRYQCPLKEGIGAFFVTAALAEHVQTTHFGEEAMKNRNK